MKLAVGAGKLWIISAVFFVSLQALAGDLGTDGFGGYKFGMTFEEADRARDNDQAIDCDFVAVFKCLQYTSEFYGQSALVVGQIDMATRKLKRVVVQFDRTKATEPGACMAALDAVMPRLWAKYGSDAGHQRGQAVWHLPAGGTVTLSNVCITEDKGIVVVTYEPGSTL